MKLGAPLSPALRAIHWVPGLPHLLEPHLVGDHKVLHDGFAALRASLKDQGVRRIVYYSTQWLSVLGQSFQARSALRGLHVDENWHELADLPYDFVVDRPFAARMAKDVMAVGVPTQLVDYEGFPVDTGTIVADRLLNPDSLSVGMVSSWVYADAAQTRAIGAAVRRAIEGDATPTAVVAVSLLSSNFFTHEIDLREDRIRDRMDHEWNLRLLELWQSGDHEAARDAMPEFARAAKAEFALKAYAFCEGIAAGDWLRPARCHGYGALYGAGAAVLEF